MNALRSVWVATMGIAIGVGLSLIVFGAMVGFLIAGQPCPPAR